MGNAIKKEKKPYQEPQNAAVTANPQDAFNEALENARKREREVTALLEGARAILEYRDFETAARSIFNTCKKLIGATAGYVALLSEDGSENQVVFLESGGLSCTVNPDLPMPIRGMRGEVCRELKSKYENDFEHSGWLKFLPKGHVRLENVLFAPLLINNRVMGLLGLSNKPGGFNDNDLRLASAFGEYAAIALNNNWTLEMLARSEERYHKVVDTADDAIISFDSSGNVASWNSGAEMIFGYKPQEALGMAFGSILDIEFRPQVKNWMSELSCPMPHSDPLRKPVEVTGLRKGGDGFPAELSLTSWNTREGTFFTAIMRDITERKKTVEKIRRLNDELSGRTMQLETANKDLEGFSYSVSHDLRVPLRAISGFAGILKDEHSQKLDGEARHYLQMICDSSFQMGLLIDDLLTFSRLGRKELEKWEVDPAELARKALSELKAETDGRDVKVSIGSLPSCEGDPALLKQVFLNLLSNALKFTRKKDNARIEVGSRSSEGRTAYFVKDNGVGFDMAYAGKLFGVFQRFHRPEEYEGTGVGLAIVKRIINRHGGEVWAEAKPGEGASFYFTLGGKNGLR